MKINCAKTLGRQLRQLLVEKGTALADDLAGKSVICQGRAMTVDSVAMADRKITVMDMQGQRSTQSFDKFFREPVTLIQPDLLLEPITPEGIQILRPDRFLFRNGERWQVRKVNRQPEMEPLITLENGKGQYSIQSGAELRKNGWLLRRKAKPSVSQRLAGIYAKLGESLDKGKTWAAPVPPVPESERENRLDRAVKIYRRLRTQRT